MFRDWRNSELSEIETLMNKREIERVKVGTNSIQSMPEYKKIIGAKYETKTVKVPSGEFIGKGKLKYEFKKNEEQKTGNVVIPKQKLDKFLQDHQNH